MNRSDDRVARALDVVAFACALLALAVILLTSPRLAIWLHNGPADQLSIQETGRGWLLLVAHHAWLDPASAFDRSAARAMPAAGGFWASVGIDVAFVALFGFAALRQVDRLISPAVLGRRWFSPHGSRTRAWARPRDITSLALDRPDPNRLALGSLGRSKTLAALEELNMILIAPTRSGKTSRFVIPWVIDAPGPVISLSVKGDVYQTTAGYRSKLGGRVWKWDPFGQGSARWSPLLGCDNWATAIRHAHWLADCGGEGRDSEAARFWNLEAAKLLAPLLHAAALAHLHMVDVLAWLDGREEDEVKLILQQHEAMTAMLQFDATVGLDSRNAGTTYMSAANLVSAYRHPEVQDAESIDDLSAEEFLDGKPNTLYIVAGADDQERLAPLVVALLREILSLAADRAHRHGQPIKPTLRFVGDELPNIAPIRALPRYKATLLDAGVRMISVCQDIAQLRAVYGPETDTILSNCQAKLFLGPVSCTETRKYIVDLLGDEDAATTSRTAGRGSNTESSVRRPRATAQALQQLDGRRALLVHSNLPAAVIDTRPWWERPEVARNCDLPIACAPKRDA